MHIDDSRRSIAVIGSGVAGLTAAYTLSRHDRVTLFEADDRLGGHAHSHVVDRGDGVMERIDSAFLVHNSRTYPTLCRLFYELNIATRDTDMSMSVRSDETGLEYAGARGLGGLFPSLANLTRPRYLAMLVEVRKFHRHATALLRSSDAAPDEPLRGFLQRHGFSPFFVQHFMTPLVAAVWSCSPDTALDYPARYLFVFLEHHGMLTVFGSPSWRTVVGGSATYVEAIAQHLDEVRLGTPVRALRRTRTGVQIRTDRAALEDFDAVVIATHSDQALALLAEPTRRERAVLGAIGYTPNLARLHTDESVLPRSRRARASWNYLITGRSDAVAVTYDITHLMRLGGTRRFLLTLGDHDLVAPERTLVTMTYHHPQYTLESVAAQQHLANLDDDRVVFAGAYHGWGFHEDGAASGLRAARRLQRTAVQQ